MTEKPEALRLADELTRYLGCGGTASQAAAELRRLSIENERIGPLAERVLELTSQRDALLEALQSIADCCDEEHAARDYASRQTEIRGIARAAIKVVEGEKT